MSVNLSRENVPALGDMTSSSLKVFLLLNCSILSFEI